MEALICPQCGYDLTGLPENRCPECGVPFDPVALSEKQRQEKLDTVSGRTQVLRRARFGEVVAVQVVMGVVFSLILDGGRLLTCYLISLTAYWVAVPVYILRRQSFKEGQLTLLRLAWIPILFLTFLMAAVYTSLS